MMAKVFSELQTNWLYTAVIQASLQGPEPAWSSQGWSFVPLDLASLTPKLSPQLAIQTEIGTTHQSTSVANLTVQTTALRARAECSVVENLGPKSWLMAQNDTKFLQDQNLTSYDVVYHPFYWPSL